MGYFMKIILAGLFLLLATAAHAVPVSIQTNGYTQEWYTQEITTWTSSPYYKGDKVVDLNPGPYYLTIGHPGAGGTAHRIDVLADGSVNDAFQTGAITLSPGVISFNTMSVTVDPNSYAGRWQLGTSGWKKLQEAVTVVKGQHYGLSLGWPMGTGFSIDASGNISVDDPISMAVSGSVLTLNTVPVNFDPVNYLGQYAIHYGDTWHSGKNTLMLVPNQNYYFGIAGMDAVWFALDAQGNVNLDFTKGPSGPNPIQYWVDRISDKSISALPSTGSRIDTIRFKNTSATIDTGSYAGFVALHRILVGGKGRLSGKHDVVLVPNLRNGIYLNAWGHFFFNVDEIGNLTVENGVSANVSYSPVTGLNSDMVLNFHELQIDPGAYTGNWDMWEGSGLNLGNTTGQQIVTMVDGVDYPIRIASPPFTSTVVSDVWFQVAPDCSISPTDAVSVGAEIFKLSCVNRNIAPIANAGAAQTVEQTSPAGALVTLNGAASSDADGNALTFAWSGPFGSATGVAPTVQFPAGSSNANLVVNDGTVDSTPSSVMITVQDTTAPAVTAPAAVTAEATGAQTTVIIGTATATDAVGVVSISSDAPATFPLGTTTVIWMATDAAGNVGSAVQSVTVSDTTAPVLTVPTDVTAEATGPQTSIAIGTATATDIFGATVASNAPATFPVGATTVTYTAIDGNGLTTTGTQTVTVTDTTAPVITAPADVSVEANAVSSTVAIGTATASDLVDGAVSVSNNAPATFLLGTTVVTYTAIDAAGNTATVTQSITVVDTIAPAVTAALVPVDLEKDEGQFRVEFTSTDIADPNPAVVATLNGATVTNGQIVKLEREQRAKVENEHGKLEIKGISFSLNVSANDVSGNRGNAAAAYAFPPEHDDDDDKKHKKDKKDKKKSNKDKKND